MPKPKAVATGSNDIVSTIWFLGAVLAVLVALAPLLDSWWLCLPAAAAALGLTAAVAMRAARQAAAKRQATEEAAQTLAQAEEQLAGLTRALDALPAPAAICDPAGNVVAASGALARLAGADGVTGRVLEALVGTEAARQALNTPDSTAVATGRNGQTEVRILSAPARGNMRAVLLLPRDAEAAQAKQFEDREKEFRQTSKHINELAQRLASSSELMSAYADDQAKGSRKQKEQTVAVTGSIERMMGAVMEIASNASATSEAAGEARQVARDGVGLVNEAVRGVDALSHSAAELADVLTGLDNQAAEIGRIIGVITDIADQTNLLALNAAIEAARAGDAGRGFAVVADEVRKLAEKTMTATQEVKTAITTIQQSSKEAVASMDRTGKQVTESTGLSNQAGQALEKVMERIEGMVDRVQQIAHAAEQQSAAAEDISRSVEEIADIARDADEGATQQAYATRDIASLSSELLKVSQTVAGTGGNGKIAKSAGRMKGVLPKLMQDFLREKYGKKVYDAVQEQMGDPTFLPSESYPDAALLQMAELASAASGKPVKKVLYDLGTETIKGFHKLYKRYFKTKDLKTFLMTMNEIHAEVVRDMPGVTPPRFTYEDKGDVLFMNYTSSRGLFDYFEGILNGATTFLGQRAQIKVKPLDKETARAEIHFLDCDSKTECGPLRK